MPLNKPFQHQPSTIASYDAVDIISGTGYITLYGGTTVDKNVLSNVVFYSNHVAEATQAMTTNSWVKKFDYDFDVTINKPLQLRGTAIVTVPMRVTNNAAGGQSGNSYAVAILKKEDAAIVTNTSLGLGQANSDATDNGWGANIGYGAPTIDLVIPAGTSFKKGDTLRLTIEVWAKLGSVGTGTVTFAHDPENRINDWYVSSSWDTTGATMTSQLKLQLPIKIDL